MAQVLDGQAAAVERGGTGMTIQAAVKRESYELPPCPRCGGVVEAGRQDHPPVGDVWVMCRRCRSHGGIRRINQGMSYTYEVYWHERWAA